MPKINPKHRKYPPLNYFPGPVFTRGITFDMHFDMRETLQVLQTVNLKRNAVRRRYFN